MVNGEALPSFRYHPDPVGTGNVVARLIVCAVCGEPRSHVYIGPYVSPDLHFENEDALCPWCIADGAAAARWQASFVAAAYLSEEARTRMPADQVAELELRTPSFLCVQQERWLDHHGEAAQYLGEIGLEEYTGLPASAQAAVREAAGDDPAGSAGGGDGVQLLRADGDGPAVYLFQCLHCDWHGAFYAGT